MQRVAAAWAAPAAPAAHTDRCATKGPQQQRRGCANWQPAPQQPWAPSQRPQRRRSACRAEGGGGSSGGRPSGAELDALLYGGEEVPLSRLQQQLEAAVEEEDYELAAQLRDVLQRRRFDSRLAVEEANEAFYRAFQSGSLAAMGEVWGKGEHVQCIHPLAGCIAGRQSVMESWKMILGAGRMRITLEDVRIFAADTQAFVTCVEVTESGEGKGRIAATNVFEKQGGKWKLVHHHGGPAPR